MVQVHLNLVRTITAITQICQIATLGLTQFPCPLLKGRIGTDAALTFTEDPIRLPQLLPSLRWCIVQQMFVGKCNFLARLDSFLRYQNLHIISVV